MPISFNFQILTFHLPLEFKFMPTAESEEYISPIDFTPKTSSHQSSNSSCQSLESQTSRQDEHSRETPCSKHEQIIRKLVVLPIPLRMSATIRPTICYCAGRRLALQSTTLTGWLFSEVSGNTSSLLPKYISINITPNPP